MDVKTAFLNGTLEEDIFMTIPEGVDCDDVIRATKICRLKKSLYGLKISPKRWNEKFKKEVEKLGLESDINEPCLFTWRKQGKMALIVLYVDDMVIASNDKEKLKEIKEKLSAAFKMKDLGEPGTFLGMKIERDRKNKVMKISQAEYTERVLERFNMSQTTPHDTPMVTRKVKKSSLKDSEKEREKETSRETKVPFREAIGSLLYLSGVTRPDIAYAVGVLARRQRNPTVSDWEEVKRIFQYLRGTTKLGLTYRAKTKSLEAMTDSSLMDCEESRSTGGYLIKLGGDTISWRSHKQPLVSKSACEAETFALSEVCQELISLDKALRDITGKTNYPVIIRCDNKAAVDNTEKEGCHRLKSFDESIETIKRNLELREETGNRRKMSEAHGDYIKQCVAEGKVRVKWISTKENIADIFTKPLALGSFKSLREGLLNLRE